MSDFWLALEIEEEGCGCAHQVRSSTLNYCDVIGGDILVLFNSPRFDHRTVFSKQGKLLPLDGDISGSSRPFELILEPFSLVAPRLWA